MNFLKSKFAIPLFSLLVVWIACLVVLGWVFWPIGYLLNYPIVYNGDGLWNLFVIKTVLETGWYGDNPYLGAPSSAIFLDFPKPEVLYLLIFRLAGLATDNVALIHNLFYFLGFFLVSGVALIALRRGFHLSWPLAVAGALLYVFLPYHFMRQGHLFLSNYFTVPIAVWIALMVVTSRPPFFENGRLVVAKWPVLLAVAIIASTSIYYTFFSLSLIAIAGCLESIRTKLWRHSLSALLVCFSIVFFLLLNLSPSIRYRAEQGMNSQVASRSLAEVDRYALQPIQLLLPIKDHRLSTFAELAHKYEAEASFVNENQSSYLGLLGGMGFLCLLVALISGHRAVHMDALFGFAARTNIILLSLSVVGGGGAILGLLLNPQFRAFNRISVVIAFVSIAGLLLLFEKFSMRFKEQLRQRFLVVTSILLVTIGVFDQTPLNAGPDLEKLVAEYNNDRAFVRNIEASLPNGALILQLPYTPFPEGAPNFHESPYTHLRGYLHGKKLRWSYGVMKGRMGWHEGFSLLPLEEQVKAAQSIGFSGVWLDRRAFYDGGVNLDTVLHSLGIVVFYESADKNLVFYPLSLTDDLPLEFLPSLTLGAGFYPWEGSGEYKWAWSRGNASLILKNPSSKSRRVSFSFTLSSLVERSVRITLLNQSLGFLVLSPNALKNVNLKLDLLPGKTEVFLNSEQPPVVPNSADTRQLAMNIGSVKLELIEPPN